MRLAYGWQWIAQTNSVLKLGMKTRNAAGDCRLNIRIDNRVGRYALAVQFAVRGEYLPIPLIFGAVVLILATAAVLACYFPARRAAHCRYVP